MQYYKIVHLWMKMLQNTTLTFPWTPFEKTEAQIYDFHFANSAYFCRLKPTSNVTFEIKYTKTYSPLQHFIHLFPFFSENFTMVESFNY